VAERLLEFKDRILAHRTPCGIIGTDADDARRRRQQGFQMVGLGSDAGLLARGIASGLAQLTKANAVH
jgi:2-keto-3-deoxy-L-rhamnonate aldolase RhmA